MDLRIEDCTDAAFRRVAPRLRVEDQTEWRVSAGDTPAGLYKRGDYSLPAGAGTLNRIAYSPEGVALAVWGVSPAYPEGSYYYDKIGWVWLVATPEAVPVARPMHRYLKGEFDKIKAMYPILICASHIRNPVHHTWLRWLGFVEKPKKIVTQYGGVLVPFQFGGVA